jgi:hypothetical protein
MVLSREKFLQLQYQNLIQVLANVPYANVASALQGNIAGLRVQSISGTTGAAPRIILRGGTSISNPDGSTPLYIVDGIIRGIDDLNLMILNRYRY